MFSLFLVASLVLPSVLGHCCSPDKMSMLAYNAGNPVGSHIVVDFTQNKYVVMPDAGDRKYILDNIANGKQYTIYDDGSCISQDNPIQFHQCITSPFKDLGANTLGQTMGIKTFGMKTDDGNVVFSVTDGCLPVLNIQTHGDETTTRIYANVTTSVSDLSALDQDLSKCSEKV